MKEITYKNKTYIHISDFAELNKTTENAIRRKISYAKLTKQEKPYKTIKLKPGHWIYYRDLKKS